MALGGRTVWITGASSGIGAAVAEELARRGARVAVTARNAEALEALAAATPGSWRRPATSPIARASPAWRPRSRRAWARSTSRS